MDEYPWQNSNRDPFLKERIKNRVHKYAKFGIFYAKIVQMTPLRLQRESL